MNAIRTVAAEVHDHATFTLGRLSSNYPLLEHGHRMVLLPPNRCPCLQVKDAERKVGQIERSGTESFDITAIRHVARQVLCSWPTAEYRRLMWPRLAS